MRGSTMHKAAAFAPIDHSVMSQLEANKNSKYNFEMDWWLRTQLNYERCVSPNRVFFVLSLDRGTQLEDRTMLLSGKKHDV